MGQNFMKLIDYSRKIAGTPYCAGGIDPSVGLGCFTIVYDWIKVHIPNLPEEYHGYTLVNRRQLYDADPNSANEMMIRFFDEYLEFIKPSFAFVGDILWTSVIWKDAEYFASAIHAGNGYMLGATPQRGVILIPLRMYKILKAWKIPGANR